MHIVIVSDAWTPQINGVVHTITRTRDELVKLGHQVTVIGPDRFRNAPCPTYPEIRLALFPGRRLRRLLEEARPDAIHISTEGPLGLSARRWCLKRGFPFTTTFHTQFPEYVKLRSGIPLFLTYRMMRWFHDPATTLMVATPTLRRRLENRGFSNLGIWSRGVDTQLFRPRDKDALDLPRPIFLYMGRVAIEKNIEAFLKLDLPGSKVVVGGGPDLEMLKKRYPGTHFTGYKTGEDLARHVAAGDVFVFPSLTETFGLVIIEALACGLPVAAFPVQGPIDIIENGVTGWLDEDLRAAALKAVDIDPDRCRRQALQYTWESCTRQFLAHVEAGNGAAGAAPALESTAARSAGAR